MDYSCSVEGDITEHRAIESSQCLLTANSCRLPHRGHRMSLFLQILALPDICSASRTIQVEVGVFHEEDFDAVRSVCTRGRSDDAVGAGAADRIAGSLRKRCRNAFRQV